MYSRVLNSIVSFRLIGWSCLAALGLPAARFNAVAFTAADAQTMVDSFNSAFYFTSSGNRGYFRNSTAGGTTWFWGRANQMEMLIDLYEQTTNTAYLTQFQQLYNGFASDYGTSWTWNEYNDDIMWMVIACSRAYQHTGNTTYRSVAKSNFDACHARAWDMVVDGGLYWKYPVNSSKNACVNGPAAIAAYLIYQNYGDTNYLVKAETIYQWLRAKLFNASTGLIADYIGTNGVVYGGSTTYNQGTFLGAANFLGYTNDALLAANHTKNSMGTGGQLPNYDENSDLGNFNAIFIRWMVKFMNERGLQAIYQPWLQQNANAAWNMRRRSDNISWSKWWDQTPEGTRYSVGCWGSVMAMNLVPPTQNPTGAVVVLNASDAAGSSSFGSALNWSDGTAPSAAKNYLVHSARTLRTPQNTSHHSFAGSSLTLSNGAVLAFKNTSGGRYVSVGTDLFLDGGEVHNWAGNSASLGGKVTLRAGGGKIDPQGNSFSFPALIGGPGMLRIGAGPNTPLNGANTYTGGTVIEAPHTVQVINPASLGSETGSLSFSNSVGRGYGTLNLNGTNLSIGNLRGAGGVIINNKSNTVSVLTIGNSDSTGGVFQGVIADANGAIAVTKVGTGTLTLAGVNTFSGKVDLQAGTLAIGSGVALGKGQLNFNGGTTGATIQSADGTMRIITNAINFDGGVGANTIFGGMGNLRFTATPTPNGTAKNLTVNNPQTEFSGVLGGASARTVAGTGTLILSGANTYSQGTTINPGATLQLGNGGVTGSLSTSGAIVNNGTLRFNRGDVLVQGTHFSGTPISGTGGLVQAGSGATLLTAANTCTGTAVVNNGLLGGTGSIAGSLHVQPGGTLAPGIPPVGSLTPALGTLTASNTTIDGAVLMKISRSGAPASDRLAAPAIVANAGSTLTVTVLGSASFAAGDTFTLFTTPVSGAFSTLNLPTLPDAGLAWADQLAVDGSITVVSAVSTVPTHLVVQFSSDALTLSWPADHTGWRLQTQTNSLAAGLGTNWFDVPGAASTNQMTLPFSDDAGAVFFRLIYP